MFVDSVHGAFTPCVALISCGVGVAAETGVLGAGGPRPCCVPGAALGPGGELTVASGIQLHSVHPLTPLCLAAAATCYFATHTLITQRWPMIDYGVRSLAVC